MKKRTTLNHDLLAQVKRAFVAMPGGSDPMAGPGPVAGGGMLSQAQAAPMGADPAAMGGAPMDPAMMGGDPAAMGGAPMDPAAMGGAPMDPAMMGGDPAAMGAAPGGMVTMSSQEFKDLMVTMISMLSGGKAPKAEKAKSPDAGGDPAAAAGGAAPAAPAGGESGGGSDAKLDQIIQLLSAPPAGAPPMDPAMAGMPPPPM